MTAKILRIKATITTWTTTDLFLNDSPINHPIFSSLVSSKIFNLAFSNNIEPSQPLPNSSKDIC